MVPTHSPPLPPAAKLQGVITASKSYMVISLLLHICHDTGPGPDIRIITLVPVDASTSQRHSLGYTRSGVLTMSYAQQCADALPRIHPELCCVCRRRSRLLTVSDMMLHISRAIETRRSSPYLCNLDKAPSAQSHHASPAQY